MIVITWLKEWFSTGGLTKKVLSFWFGLALLTLLILGFAVSAGFLWIAGFLVFAGSMIVAVMEDDLH